MNPENRTNVGTPAVFIVPEGLNRIFRSLHVYNRIKNMIENRIAEQIDTDDFINAFVDEKYSQLFFLIYILL